MLFANEHDKRKYTENILQLVAATCPNLPQYAAISSALRWL